MTENFKVFRGSSAEYSSFLKRLKYISTASEIKKGIGDPRYAFRDYLDNHVISQDASSGRIFFMANEHDEIIPFFELAIERRWLIPPIRNANYDFHYDISPYNDTDPLFASWQWYGIDIGILAKDLSCTVVPSNPSHNLTCVTEFEAADELSIPPVDAASVDIDYFNHLAPHGKQWDMMLDNLKSRVAQTPVSMVFLSPRFCRHPYSIDIARQLFTAAIKIPRNPLTS